MIKVSNIHKAYGNVKVLNGIDLEVNKAEIVSIVGKSGAGKTTLLQIIGTLLDADLGTVTINETEVSKLKEKALSKFRNSNLGFIFQSHQLLPEFTALENVMIPGLITQKSRKEVEDKAKEILEFLDLGHRLEHKPKELSGGEQQRIAVARALLNEPEVILADEPSGNLDSEASDSLHKLIFNLRKELNQTFVIVTHNKELADMADRKLEILDGRI